ncbi:hypothetical protein BG000_007001, partial [Podila horticola]
HVPEAADVVVVAAVMATVIAVFADVAPAAQEPDDCDVQGYGVGGAGADQVHGMAVTIALAVAEVVTLVAGHIAGLKEIWNWDPELGWEENVDAVDEGPVEIVRAKGPAVVASAKDVFGTNVNELDGKFPEIVVVPGTEAAAGEVTGDDEANSKGVAGNDEDGSDKAMKELEKAGSAAVVLDSPDNETDGAK